VSAIPAIGRLDPADTGAVSKLVDVQLAALAVDDPTCPPWSARVFKLRMTAGLPLRGPGELWWTPGDLPGGLAGGYWLQLPDLDNLESAWVDLFVHPAARSRGLGTALLRHAVERAASHGRPRVGGRVVQGSAGEALARSAGATIGLAEMRRVLDLGQVSARHIAGCREKATVAAAGYSLASWLGRTPEEYLKGVASMGNAMNDAPSRPGAEPEVWNEQRVRDRKDGWIEAVGARPYQVAALCDATGEMAALSELAVYPDVPDWGFQSDTVVARPHRGHRLGMLVKAAMLEWLAEAEPGLRRIVTHNAASNSHMIAINEELGFAVSGQLQLDVELAAGGES
jgi:GNAT superfamily N-acetyltransferase